MHERVASIRVLALLCLGMAGAHRAAALDVPASDYRQLVQRIDRQEAAIESFRRTLQDLRSEVARMRSVTDQLKPLATAPRPYATQEQYLRLAEQVRSVERNRLADRGQILAAIENLRSLAKDSGAPRPAPNAGKPKPGPKAGAKKAAPPGRKKAAA